jgi:CheY-like chemotaxis protein
MIQRPSSKVLPDSLEVDVELGGSTLPQDPWPLAEPVRDQNINFDPSVNRARNWLDADDTLPSGLDALVDDGSHLRQTIPTREPVMEHVIAGPSTAENYPRGGPKSKRVLMVDDDLTARLYMRAKLMLRGNVEMLEVSSGALALKLMETQAFDAVLLDIDLGEINGYEVCRMIRTLVRKQGGPQPKICMITGRGSIMDKIRAKMAGADIFLTKPPHPTEFAQFLALL